MIKTLIACTQFPPILLFRYSSKEKKKLKIYQSMYGNNWKKISELMCRSTHSVALKYSQIKSGTQASNRAILNMLTQVSVQRCYSPVRLHRIGITQQVDMDLVAARLRLLCSSLQQGCIVLRAPNSHRIIEIALEGAFRVKVQPPAQRHSEH